MSAYPVCWAVVVEDPTGAGDCARNLTSDPSNIPDGFAWQYSDPDGSRYYAHPETGQRCAVHPLFSAADAADYGVGVGA